METFNFDELPLELRVEIGRGLDEPSRLCLSWTCTNYLRVFPQPNNCIGPCYIEQCIKWDHPVLLKWAISEGCPIDSSAFRHAQHLSSLPMLKYLKRLSSTKKELNATLRSIVMFGCGRLKHTAALQKLLEKSVRKRENLEFLGAAFWKGAVASGDIEYVKTIEPILLSANNSSMKGIVWEHETLIHLALAEACEIDHVELFSYFYGRKMKRTIPDIQYTPLRRTTLWLITNREAPVVGPRRLHFFVTALLQHSVRNELEDAKFMVENAFQFFSSSGRHHYKLIIKHLAKHCRLEFLQYFSERMLKGAVMSNPPAIDMILSFSANFLPSNEIESERQFGCFKVLMDTFHYGTALMDPQNTVYSKTYFEPFNTIVGDSQNIEIIEIVKNIGIDVLASAGFRKFLVDLFKHPDPNKFTDFNTIPLLRYLESHNVNIDAVLQSIYLNHPIVDFMVSRALQYCNIVLLEYVLSRPDSAKISIIDETQFLAFVTSFSKKLLSESRLPQHRFFKTLKQLHEAGKLANTESLRIHLAQLPSCYLVRQLTFMLSK